MSTYHPMNNNSNEIQSLETLDDLITILTQVRNDVGGKVKVMVASDARDVLYEDDCSPIDDVMMCGVQSMMKKHDSEDTRVVIVL